MPIQTFAKAKLPKFIKRITLIKSKTSKLADSAAQLVVVKAKRKRKKQSRGLIRVWERLVRRGAQAGADQADEYLDRHRRSNRKKRDGWLRDYSYNMIRASRKGRKRIKLSRIFR